MGSSDTKISTLEFPKGISRSTAQREVAKYTPPFRNFNQASKKISEKQTQFFINISKPYDQIFQIDTTIYKELIDAFETKTKNIVIQNVYSDEQNIDRYVYEAVDSGKKETILIRPFKDYESHLFGNLLCEVHFCEMINQFNCPNLHHYIESFVVETGIETLEQPNSYIIIMEGVGTNLSEIITYRRKNRWEWTVKQFDRLVADVVNGLATLHEKGLAHNDIRPSTIYYSVEKNCYMLGSFSNCLKDDGSLNTNKIKSMSHFNAPELSVEASCSLQKGDVYSLGLTLLCGFYLCEPIDRKEYVPLNKHFKGKYDVLSIIQEMMAPAEQRKSISAIKSLLPSSNYKYQNMGNLIESLRQKNRPDLNGVAKNKLIFGEAYQRLGLWNQWKKEYQEAFQILQPTYDPYHKAQVLKELAVVENCRGQFQIASQHAKKASNIYRDLGYKQLHEGNSGLAESYFKKGLSCAKYFQFQNDIDLARTLQGLSEVHAAKNEYVLSKTLITEASNVAGKSEGKDSYEYCRLKLKEATIQSQFGQFDQADRILTNCLEIAKKKEQINPKQSNKLKGDILLQKSKNYSKKSSYEPAKQSKDAFLQRAQQSAIESLQVYQKIEQDNHLKVSQIITALGQIQFKKGNYPQAKNDFQKALELVKHHQKTNNNGQEVKQSADVLCRIGSCQTYLSDHTQAIKSYDQALKLYKKIYGTDHNRYSAMAIGNLARVYTNLKEKVKARQCLKCATNILGDILGKHDPDYEHFKAVEEKLDSM